MLCRPPRGQRSTNTRGYQRSRRTRELHQRQTSPKKQIYLPRGGACKRRRHQPHLGTILHICNTHSTPHRRVRRTIANALGDMYSGSNLRLDNGLVGAIEEHRRDIATVTRTRRARTINNIGSVQRALPISFTQWQSAWSQATLPRHLSSAT